VEVDTWPVDELTLPDVVEEVLDTAPVDVDT
jgi:hypothetical protein